uniref:hypothetical protein n=1 Tax=Endozoicomonas sp. SESOKO1 TaxID=2828742 RepID=UPI0021496957
GKMGFRPGGGGTTTPPETFAITALDGYLKNAEVRVDTNNDNACESTLIANTGDKGSAQIPVEYQNNTLCITALPGITVDESRGVVTKNVELKAPAGERVVSPMTDLVVAQLKANPTPEDIVAAKDIVVSKFDSELGLTADDIFTDYVANANNPKAQAINAIGEALFDADKNLTVEQKLGAVEQASGQAQEVITNNGSLENFAPVIGNEGSVTPNQRPSITVGHESGELNRTIEVGQAFTEVDVAGWFADSDNDPLTYSVEVLPASGSSLTITGSTIQGTPEKAGNYEVYVYAYDGKTRSYPVKFVLEVTAENAEPQLNEQAAGEIQSFLNGLQLTQGQTEDTTISIADLFTDDDPLKLTAETDITGLTVSVDENQMLVIGGTPSVSGKDLSIFVYANDGVNQQAGTVFSLDVAEAVQDQHPLEGKPLYRLTDGNDDGDASTADFTQVWCDTFLFEGGDVLSNTRTIANRTSCSEQLESVGSYAVDGSKLNITWDSNGDGVITNMSLIDQSLAANGAGLLLEHTEDGKTRAELYFANKAHAEQRIQLTSDTPEGQGDFGFYQPKALRSNYQPGKVSVSMGLPVQNDEGDLDIDLYFDSLPAADNPTQANCESRIKALYSSFEIVSSEASDNIGVTKQFFPGDNNTSCVVDYDITGSTHDGQVFGVIAKSARSEVISDLLFNIEWNHPGSGLLPEVTEAELQDFLEGSSRNDYRYQGSLNSVRFDSVEATVFFEGQACMGDVCDADYTFEGDELVLQIGADTERDQFIYTSAEVAFAVTGSKDLIAWGKKDYSAAENQTGWTSEQLTGKTWFYVDDDSTSTAAAPMFASFHFVSDTQVKVSETKTLPWSITNGVLTIDFPEGGSDLVLNRYNASGDVVLATEANGKPLIMSENENLARGIFSKWKNKD